VVIIPPENLTIQKIYSNIKKNPESAYAYKFIRHVNFPSIPNAAISNQLYIMFGSDNANNEPFLISVRYLRKILEKFITINKDNKSVRKKFA